MPAERIALAINTTTDLQQTVEDAAAHLYVWSLKDIPQDLRDALRNAMETETHKVGKRILEPTTPTAGGPDERKTLASQARALAVYSVRWGERSPLPPPRIEQALRGGTRRATLEHPLRSN